MDNSSGQMVLGEEAEEEELLDEDEDQETSSPAAQPIPAPAKATTVPPHQDDKGAVTSVVDDDDDDDEQGEETGPVSAFLPSEGALEKACVDYAAFVELPDKAKTELGAVDSSVEKMLGRLEEFSNLVATIGPETQNTVDNLLPSLLIKTKQLELLFTMIDAMQHFVGGIKGSVDQMEERLTESEQHFNNLNPTTVSRLFNAFSWRKPEPTGTMPAWKPVPIVESNEIVELKLKLLSIFFDGIPGTTA
eukprot:TRINITY_DN2803_c0_g1_i1.p1 TRINITY_DN2803_c0_g1~~TRINITY_DN2803_c0_g1_i1.p1  ORF type:complete len:248 (-),score=72.64 TRINITY_DN2803_c0_g1_i1:81-824(-)